MLKIFVLITNALFISNKIALYAYCIIGSIYGIWLVVFGFSLYHNFLSALVAFRESYSSSWDIFYYLLWPVHGVFLFFGFVLFWLDGRVTFNRLFSYSRIRTIFIIFLIFLLSAWLSSWLLIFLIHTPNTSSEEAF